MNFRLLMTFLLLFSCSVMATEEFNFEELSKLISNKKITSIDKLIEVLPEDLKKNFTLMKKSQSLHEASYDKPRAILFGNTGNLIVTFNSDSTQKGGNAVEIMEFSKTPTPHFEMREIEFDPKGVNSPQISKSNPDKCLVCHGNPPKPIWGNYDDDKNGAYGASLDGLSEIEKKEFAEFREQAKNHPRYNKLHLPEEDKFYPYTKKEILLVQNLPNLRLTSLLLNNLAEVHASRLEKDPYIFTFLFATQCSFSKEEDQYIDPLTLLLRSRGIQGDLSGVGEEILKDAKVMKQYFSSESLYGDNLNHFFYPLKVREAFNIHYDDLSLEFVKGRQDKTNSGFFSDSTDILKNNLLRRLKLKSPEKLKLNPNLKFFNTFEKTLKGSDPIYISTLASSGGFDRYYNDRDYCQALSPLMKKELDKFLLQPSPKCFNDNKEPSVAKDLIENISKLNQIIQNDRSAIFKKLAREKKCIDCHDQSGMTMIGPEIPFLSDIDLAKKLNDDKDLYKKFEHRTDPTVTDVARMPLGQPALNEKEREEILEYLKGLIK